MMQRNPTLDGGKTIRQFLSVLVYGIFRAALRIIFPVCFKVTVRGLEQVPKTPGGLMIVCNHISEWDPPFLGSFLPWQVHWMAKVELFQLCGGKMDGFFRMLHCVPVNRQKVDLAAVKTVVQILKSKKPVVVFAEGGIRTDENSLLGNKPQLKEGAAIMALLSGSRMLPALLNGTMAAYDKSNWLPWKRPHLEIVFGPVFTLHTKDRSEATEKILDQLVALKSQLKQQQPC
jgi:1-acyl-sn-glycerol-3-phosphate acyltransferase